MGSWSSLLLAKLWLKLIQQKRFLCNFVEVFHQTTAISEIFLRAIRIHNFQFSPLEYTLSKIVCSKWTENQIFLKTSFVKFYSVYTWNFILGWNDYGEMTLTVYMILPRWNFISGQTHFWRMYCFPNVWT